jgi:hypothetical protein
MSFGPILRSLATIAGPGSPSPNPRCSPMFPASHTIPQQLPGIVPGQLSAIHLPAPPLPWESTSGKFCGISMDLLPGRLRGRSGSENSSVKDLRHETLE